MSTDPDQGRHEFADAVKKARLARSKSKALERAKHPNAKKAAHHAKKLTKGTSDWHSFNENYQGDF